MDTRINNVNTNLPKKIFELTFEVDIIVINKNGF